MSTYIYFHGKVRKIFTSSYDMPEQVDKDEIAQGMYSYLPFDQHILET